MIILDGVSKRYHQQLAVDEISLSIEASITTVLIGPSGSGKSTLLRMINGLIQPDSGSVSIAGLRLTSANIQEQRQKMGYVIQEGGLFPHLSVYENVALMPRHLAWSQVKLEKRILELAELVQLSSTQLHRYPHQLSGGQRQRVSLMRALVLEPEILLLDEPLAALDPMIRYELQQQLSRIFSELHKTVVLVTHDLSEAAYFSDRIALLRDGNIEQYGLFEELIRQPASEFVSDFIQAQRAPLQSFMELQ